MKIITVLLIALSFLPLSFSTPLTETAPTPAHTKPPFQPPRTAFPGLDFTKPPELARTTPAPGDEPARAQGGGQQDGVQEIPFSQETYYTCITRDGTHTHCGWHMPIVWVGEAGVASVKVEGRGLIVGAVVMVVGVMMG